MSILFANFSIGFTDFGHFLLNLGVDAWCECLPIECMHQHIVDSVHRVNTNVLIGKVTHTLTLTVRI